MLRTIALSKRFGGVAAVTNCSIHVKKHSITAFIGPNGSGKSTVFDLISRVVLEDSGRVLLNGRDITRSSIEHVSNAGVSRLFQHPHLFDNLTVQENLLLAATNDDTRFWKNMLGHSLRASMRGVEDALELVQMRQYMHRPCRNLSYGQRRLVELAMAIVHPHTLLLLDEPVAGVAHQLRRQISNTLRALKKRGETVFLIEHDLDFVFSLADHIIVLDNGRVIAEGSAQEIKKNLKVQRAYLG